MASIFPRVLERHSGKGFTVRGLAGSSSLCVGLGEGFPECIWAFPECNKHSGRQVATVV
jgi:hypothetical protein